MWEALSVLKCSCTCVENCVLIRTLINRAYKISTTDEGFQDWQSIVGSQAFAISINVLMPYPPYVSHDNKVGRRRHWKPALLSGWPHPWQTATWGSHKCKSVTSKRPGVGFGLYAMGALAVWSSPRQAWNSDICVVVVFGGWIGSTDWCGLFCDWGLLKRCQMISNSNSLLPKLHILKMYHRKLTIINIWYHVFVSSHQLIFW